MMTSGTTSFPERLTKIDALTRPDHSHLVDEDECFFLGEYTARKGFSHSATNNLIINFKKPMDRKGTPQWKYKRQKIQQASSALFKALRGSNLRNFTFVPVPPSKQRADPLYDDRMEQMLRGFAELVFAEERYYPDIRELVTQNTSTVSVHDTDERPTPENLAGLYTVSANGFDQIKPCVVICDDVLTTGCHYRAMTIAISPYMAAPRFRGLFLARRVPEAVDLDEFE